MKISYSARFHLVRIIRVRDYLARLCFWFPVYYRLPFYIRVSYIDSEPVNSEVLVSKFDRFSQIGLRSLLTLKLVRIRI